MTCARAAALVMLAVLACGRPAASDTPPSPSGDAPAGEAPAGDAPAGEAPPRQEPSATTTRSSDGRCEPMPKVGTACGERDSYCVESWGTPGGSSSALWCRGGKWEREEERNLPADESD